MKRWLMIALVAGAGCAGSMHYQEEAQRHDQRAADAAARGDYRTAAREQDKADRDRIEAQRRAAEENGAVAPQPVAPMTNPTLPPPAVPY
jgi:hypothetical protein